MTCSSCREKDMRGVGRQGETGANEEANQVRASTATVQEVLNSSIDGDESVGEVRNVYVAPLRVRAANELSGSKFKFKATVRMRSIRRLLRPSHLSISDIYRI